MALTFNHKSTARCDAHANDAGAARKAALPVYSRKEVERHSTAESGIWVTYKDGVYDVTQFIESHPGGKARLMEAAGKDLNLFWRQAPYRQHYGSPLAAELLEEMQIGTLAPGDVLVLSNDNERRVLQYPNNKIYDCIVIGSGVSGLQTGHTLTHDHGVDNSNVLILEAQDYVGGRVRQMTEFVRGVNIDVGAEFLHGPNTELTRFAEKFKEPIHPIYCWAHGDGGPLPHPINGTFGLYFVRGKDGKKRLLRYDDKDPDFVKINETLHGIALLNPDDFDDSVSLYDYLISKGITEDMLGMAEAGFSNTLCTNLKSLSMKRCVRWESLWHAEEEGAGEEEVEESDFQFANSFKCVVDHLKKGLQIELNSPVSEVYIPESKSDPFADLVKVTTKDGFTYYAKTLVVSSSPHVLKSDLMKFSPEFPADLKEALHSVTMRNIIKVVLKFSERPWPEHLKGMIMVDEDFLMPEIWFRDVTKEALPDEPAKFYAVGFTTSEYSEKLAAMHRGDALAKCVTQLETIFSALEPRHMEVDPASGKQSSIDALPKASKVFLGGMFWDWDSQHHPYIGGGYSSPLARKNADAADNLRKAYGQGNMFFVGEATTLPGATAHAALESGIRAAGQVATKLKA